MVQIAPRFAVAAVLLLPLLAVAEPPANPQRPNGQRTEPQQGASGQPAAVDNGVAVFFSPDGGALKAVAQLIRGARKSIDVQAYMLSTKELADPLVEAQRRGVKLRVMMDGNNARDDRSLGGYLSQKGVKVFTDGEHKESHDKVMIFDGQTVVTGSFNFTRAADQENAENLLVITGRPKITAAYQKHFEDHLAHAKPLAGK